jgi:hypothetical protein
MRVATQLQAPPESVAAYIEEMVAELASLAEKSGDRNLAASLRLIAVQAARSAPDED